MAYRNVGPLHRTFLSNWPSVEECLRLAENLTTAPDVLVELAKHGNCRVRAVVAENMNTPPDTLTWLAKDPDWKVRWAVAQNLNSTPAVLALLKDDEHEMVRWAVTKSRSRSV